MRTTIVIAALVLAGPAACGGADASDLFKTLPPDDNAGAPDSSLVDSTIGAGESGEADAGDSSPAPESDAADSEPPDDADVEDASGDTALVRCPQGDRRCTSGIVEICDSTLHWNADSTCTFAANPACYRAACPPVVLRGTVASSATVTYGGSPYCTYQEHLTGVTLTIEMTSAGSVLDSHVEDTSNEASLSGCPYPGTGPSAQSFNATQGTAIQQTNGTLAITHTQTANQAPGCSLVFKGTITSEPRVSGTLSWTRTDPVPSQTLAWQNSVSIEAR